MRSLRSTHLTFTLTSILLGSILYSSVNGINSAFDLFYEAKPLIDSKRYDESLQKLQQAIQIDPNFADAYTVVGLVLYIQGKENESLTPLDTAINLYENGDASLAKTYNGAYRDKANAYFHYANSLFNLEKYNESSRAYSNAIGAYQNYGNALSMDPEPVSARNFGGKMEYTVMYPSGNLGPWNEAFNEEINTQKSQNNASLSDAYYWKGYSLYQLGQTDESTQYYEKAKAINHDFEPYSPD